MKLAIYSDVHLARYQKNKNKYNAFLNSLKSLPEQDVTDLVLLGDIIDIFIGNFAFWHQEHSMLWQTLKTLSQKGIKIIWFEGNHDFSFEKIVQHYGVQVLDGEYYLDFFSKKLFFAHGDLVDQNDKKYLRWRKTTRMPLFRRLISLIPNFATGFFYRLSRKVSSKSRKKNHQFDKKLLQRIYLDFATKLLASNKDCQGVFLGHSHIQETHLDSNSRFYINLGFWSSQEGRYCLWKADTPPEIVPVSYKRD